MSIRKTVVAGSFYPDSKKEIEDYIEQFNNYEIEENTFPNTKAIIVPHAGYIYSGFTANIAYNLSSNDLKKRIIVIGPSHRTYLEGASVALYDEYETPLGNINIDLEYSKQLIKDYEFLEFNEECDFEHSTETQMPFIKNYFKESKIVEIIYGDCDYLKLSDMINNLLEDEDNFIIISTDLSHFYTQEKANNLDAICLEAIEKKDMKLFDSCEACGKIGVKAMINIARKRNYKTKLLHYCTSADITKDKTRVVGYTSALIGN